MQRTLRGAVDGSKRAVVYIMQIVDCRLQRALEELYSVEGSRRTAEGSRGAVLGSKEDVDGST